MGIAPVASPTTKITMPYDAKTDNENFSVTEAKYYDAVPGYFFILSPKDAHRPALKVAGYDTIKKL
jgi:beta-galactosidase beta subunit